MATLTPANGNSMLDVSKLPPDLALMRIENDNIQAMAVARPRDLQAVKEDILGQLKTFPAIAEDLIYSRPVGKDDDGVEQFARNLSVRAAEMLAEAYGFNRVAAKTTLVDDNHAQVEATFVDYQRGRIWTESRPVSRTYKGKGGVMRSHTLDRFLNIVCQAERSKAIREAILRCVPPGLKQELFEAADKQMAKLLTDDQEKKIIESFASKGVTLEQLVGLIGRPTSKGWTISDRKKLAGLWRAIESDEVTIEEAFGAQRQEGAKPANAAPAENGHGQKGGVSPDDLMNPKGAAETRKEDRPPPNPKGQVGPEKPPAKEPPQESAETKLEREPGDDSDDEAGYGEETDDYSQDGDEPPLPEWAARFEIQLAECQGIREIKALGEQYAADPERSDDDKAWIGDLVYRANERIRSARGGRSNRPRQ